MRFPLLAALMLAASTASAADIRPRALVCHFVVSENETLFGVARARYAASDAVANVATTAAVRPPQLQSAVQQIPQAPSAAGIAEPCQRCRGTGNVTIGLKCSDCGGDGTLSIQDVMKIVANDRANYDATMKQLTKMRQQIEQEAKAEDTAFTPLTQAAPPQPTTPSITQTPRSAETLLTAPQSLQSVESSSAFSSPRAVPPVSEIKWLNSLADGFEQSKQQNKPGFIFWTSDVCSACLDDKAKYFTDPKVIDFLTTNFVCVEANASRETQKRLDAWHITRTPTYCVTPVDWKTYVHVERADRPEQFVGGLTHALAWAKKPTHKVLGEKR